MQLAALAATAIAVLPLAYLVIRATSGGLAAFAEVLWRPRTLELVLASVQLAVAVTASCVVLGVGLGWLVTRTDLPGRRVWQVALALPLAVPSYIAAWAWLALAPGVAGFAGSYLVLTTISYPYVLLPVVAALRRTDPALEDVARTLGLTAAQAFWRVAVPQLRPATIGGALLVGLYVISDFGAVATMRYEVLTTSIYRAYRSVFDPVPAAVLGCLVALIALLLIVAVRAVGGRRGATMAARPARRHPTARLGRLGWPTLILPAGLLALVLGVTGAGLVEWSARETVPVEWPELLGVIANTLGVSALAAACVVLIATPVAVLAARHPGWVSRVAEFSAYLGHALPGVVVGLGVVYFGIRVATPLYQEMPLLVFGYVVLFVSLALGVIHNAVAQVSPRLGEQACLLGRSRWSAAAVQVRLIAPGMSMAAALVCLTVMKELPATLFLRPTGFDTLATEVWSRINALSYAGAAPYAAAIIVLAAVPTAALSLLGERRQRRSGVAR